MKHCRSITAVLLCLSAAALLPACRRSEDSLVAKRPSEVIKCVTLASGDTLGKSLQSTGLAPVECNRIAAELRKRFDLKVHRSGDLYEVVVDSPSGWTKFRYYPGNAEKFFSLHKSTDGTIEAQRKERAIKRSLEVVSGIVDSSLWNAGISQKADPGIIMDFADIFACQIDFFTETKKGDRFKILYEKQTLDNGKTVGNVVLAAAYGMATSTYTAVRYTTKDGRPRYFSLDGRSMETAFRRAPLDYRRISSYFSRRRYHPILKRFRPHLGIDYAAPTGTPVSSVGAGIVTFAGWKGGFGKYVAIRHPNGYSSFYGHLSRIEKGISRGKRVEKGDVIGRVGSTGLSTGPHLDFRFTKNGKFENFLIMNKAQTGVIIGEKERADFEAAKKELLSRFEKI